MTRIRWTGGAYEDLVAKLMDRALVLREQPLCGRVLPELGDEAHILTVFEGHRLFGTRSGKSGEISEPGSGE